MSHRATSPMATAKQQIREQIWTLLETRHAVKPGVSGRIPAFHGADRAAARLATLPYWTAATVIEANPDRAQLPVRVLALDAGKTIYMAVPNLASGQPFYLLDPDDLPVPTATAATHQGAAGFAPTIAATDMLPVDLVVCGSVAVNPDGVRIGKGAGYSDLELALLAESGRIGPHTTIVTTVHPLQVVDGPLPEDDHDVRVDAIITTDAVITCPTGRAVPTLRWDRLTPAKIAAIPVLAELAAHRANGR